MLKIMDMKNIYNCTLKNLFNIKTSEWSVKKCLLFKFLIAHAGTVQNKKPVQFCSCFIFCTIKEHSGLVYDKRDDFDFEIVNFPFLDGDVPRSTSYGVYISQLIRFARASSYVTDFNTRNKLLTQKLLKQGYRYHKLRKTFSKFYRRYLI